MLVPNLLVGRDVSLVADKTDQPEKHRVLAVAYEDDRSSFVLCIASLDTGNLSTCRTHEARVVWEKQDSLPLTYRRLA
jgi:hypothetical protein